jgi:phosphoribosylformimino-5-aminoimidazole carboxamide ribotide isomerase
MLVVPAIDLKAGKCVYLSQGKRRRMTVFSKEPESIAKLWEAKGAQMLHVVDLEGAKAGILCNLDVVTKIRKCVKIDIELGGGIRNSRVIGKLLAKKINRIILGTSAYSNPKMVKQACSKFKDKIAVAIDAIDGKLAIEGWEKVANKKAVEFAKEVVDWGIQRIIYTDIRCDGSLTGPNYEGIKEMARAVNVPIIVAGGISTIEDVKKIRRLRRYYPIEGIIIGKALYTGKIELDVAIAIAQD